MTHFATSIGTCRLVRRAAAPAVLLCISAAANAQGEIQRYDAQCVEQEALKLYERLPQQAPKPCTAEFVIKEDKCVPMPRDQYVAAHQKLAVSGSGPLRCRIASVSAATVLSMYELTLTRIGGWCRAVVSEPLGCEPALKVSSQAPSVRAAASTPK